MHFNITGVILAGGMSSRFGQNKAFIEIGGKRLIERQIDLLGGLCREVIIVCKNTNEFSGFTCSVVRDIVDYPSPLSGIYTGLKVAIYKSSFVLACDMPFVNKGLVEYIISFAEDFDVVVPYPSGDYEPLHAIYSKNCIPYIEDMFKKNQFRIFDFYSRVRLKEITEDEIRRFDPNMLSFTNVNTRTDLEMIKDYYKAEG